MIKTAKDPNSRIVKIFRKGTFIEGAQKAQAPEFMAMSKKSLGSFWENSFSKTIGSGLTFNEQKLLLPTIVDCEPEDRNFRAKVAEYYGSIKTIVPYEKGRELEIGLSESNKDPLSAKNLPLNLADYITYRHAAAHPLCAKDKQSADGNMLVEYYIFDPQEQEDFEVKLSQDADKALELYLKIKKTPERVDMLLTLLNVDPRTFKGKNAAELKLAKLKDISEKTPDSMIKIYENKLFDDLYIMQTMLNTGVLSKVGEKIINPETATVLGNDTEEAVYWIRDKANSETLVLLKARMQEGLSKPATATSKAK